MADITWSLKADFDLSGSYETDLTGYVEKPGSGISITRGMGANGVYRVSQMAVTLSNKDGTFTPDNSASTLYGKLRPGVPIQLTATHSAVTYTLWTGYIQSFKPSWRAGQVPMCAIQCYDIAKWIADFRPVNVTASTSRDTDGALTAIATAIGFSAGDLNFDDGVQNLPLHFASGQSGMEAMLDAVRSEMGGLLWVQADGKLRFEARNSRLGTTVDDTWGDGTTIYPYAIDYDLNDSDLITTASVQATIFSNGQADDTIFVFSRGMDTRGGADSLAIAAGTFYEAEFDFGVVPTSITAAVAVTDYLGNSAIDGTGTDKTSALTVTVTDLGGRGRIKIANSDAATVYVTKLRLRGQRQAFAYQSPTFTVTKSWPLAKADSGVSLRVPFADDSQTTRDYAMHLCRIYRWPYPRITLSLYADDDTSKVALLGVELGDLVKFKDTAVGVNFAANQKAGASLDDWYYVESIRHNVPPDWAGKAFQCQVTLIPSYLYRNLDAIAYDLFTRADATGALGTSLSGDAWANDSGFNIVSNAARANTDTLSMANVTVGAAVADMVVEVSLAAIGTGDEVGVVFRYTDANNQYRAYVDKGDNKVHLEKNVAGVVTELSAPAYTVGTTAEMRVIIQGTRIRVWVDGKLYIDTTDSALATGTKAGLFARNASGTSTFDDFYSEGL